MCIYCNTTNYRKIYENHYSQIGRDTTGRKLEVHHIDGDHSNNTPSNLTLVTIQEHYNIHYAQGDWNACLALTRRMAISPEEMSILCSNLNYKRVQDGKHPFMTRTDGTNIQTDRIANGTHHFLDGAISTKNNLRRSALGINPFQGSETTKKQLLTGTHPSQIKVCCLSCKNIFGKAMFTKYHGERCKHK
jgi:hypothetical protein